MATTDTTNAVEPVELTGYLMDNPELRTTRSGKSVTTIRIAVDGPQRRTYHRIVAWNKTADAVCTYLRRGRKVEVIGREQERTYEDRDGDTRTVHEISAFRIRFLGRETRADNSESTEVAA
jgi:single-strand DNA-binding protein